MLRLWDAVCHTARRKILIKYAKKKEEDVGDQWDFGKSSKKTQLFIKTSLKV